MARKKKLTKKQIDILYECWKNAETTQERIVLIEKELPSVSPLAALSVMRSMAKSDPKWQRMLTRKKNKKNKEKIQKQKEQEKKRQEREQKRSARQKKMAEKEKKTILKSRLTKIRKNLSSKHADYMKEHIEQEIFFCPTVQHFVYTISCIFRKFSEEYILLCPECDKCQKMDKYMVTIEEMIKNEQKEGKRNKASPGRKVKAAKSKTKKERKCATKNNS